MMFSHPYFLFPLLIATLVAGYKIDESCTRAGIAQTVRDAMNSAFEMTDAGFARLGQMNQKETQDLVKNLFGKSGQNANQINTGKVRRVLNRIRYHYRREVTSGDVPWSDVIIFCDDNRLKKVSEDVGKNLWLDTTNGEIMHYKERSCRGSFGDFVALAVTHNPTSETRVLNKGTGEWEGEERELPTQIQLCPWFVDWVKKKEFKTSSDVVKRTKIGRKVIQLAESNKGVYRQIDALNLLDKVLLHEMTHGREVFTRYWRDGSGGSQTRPPLEDEDEPYDEDKMQVGLEDVAVPRSGPFDIIRRFSTPAYGWTNCQKLAQRGEPVDGNHRQAADNNADGVALFASACKLMNAPQADQRRKVDDKGRIVPMGTGR